MPQPHLAAALGAADATTAGPAGEFQPVRLPPLRQLLSFALPGVASLALFAHFVLSAEFNNGTPSYPRQGYYVLASWGELTVAAVLALITCLQPVALVAALIEQHDTGRAAGSRISAGIGLCVAAALATAAIYAVTAAVFFNWPLGDLLKWALVPVLPTAVAAAAAVPLAWRGTRTPAGGWNALFGFPASAVGAASAGTLLVCVWGLGELPWWLNGWSSVVGLAGGLLMGVAVACTLVRHPTGRLVLAVPLALFTTVISRSGLGILAVVWALSVACWCSWRVWSLARVAPLRR